MSGAAGAMADFGRAGDETDATWRESFRADERIVARALGERRLWFSERAQQVRELNPTAALIWDGLSAGQTPEAVTRSFIEAEVPAEQARSFVDDLLRGWIAAGDLRPRAIGDHPEAGCARRRYAALGLDAEVTLEGDLPAAAFDAAFGHLRAEPPGEGARLRLVGRGGRAYGLTGGRGFGAAPVEDAVPLLKAMLTESLLETLTEDFAIHAACLVRDGEAWLLLGAPGAGKSTLTAALAHAGFDYAADDLTVLRRDGTVLGAPFALALKSGSWPICEPIIPGLAALPTYTRSDGQRVRYAPPPTMVREAAPVSRIIVLDRRAGAAPRLVPLDPADAMTALLATAYSPTARLDADGFRAAAGLVARAETFTLTYANLAAAVALLAAEADRG